MMTQHLMTQVPGFGNFGGGFMMQTSTANVQWVVTSEEWNNYTQQFNKLMPVAGFLRGDQARNFFLESKLPPQVLAQIWELADFSGDGKMDKLEFAIAMKLIKLKLQGVMLPSTLPPTMKQQPMYGGGFSQPNMNAGMMAPMASVTASVPGSMPGMYNTMPAMSNGSMSMTGISQPMHINSSSNLPQTTNSPSSSSLSRHGSISDSTRSQEWDIPKHAKLKYKQMFNTHDKNKTNYLSGMQARHILSLTGLPQMTLASIWQLSDVDKDGKLTQEEFVLAMHLADMAKTGNPLPSVLSPQLVPPSQRSPQISSNIGQLGLLTPLTQMDPNNKDDPKQNANVFVSLEDKRRENFAKGNLELEKRRQALLESQQKERERIEQKEREQREKREKERMEQERKRQEEIEKQLERQRAIEREREEQRRKAIEQKEAAQREMERQRQLEWERLRRKELLQHKLREQENVTSLRAKTKTLDVELNSLQEKRAQLAQRTTDVRGRLKEQNNQLSVMNKQRELKHSLVQKQQEQIALFNQQLNNLMPEKQMLSEKIQFKGNSVHDGSLQTLHRDYQAKVFTLQRLRTQLEEMETQRKENATQLEKFNTQLNQLQEELNKHKLSVERITRIQQDKLRVLQEARRQKDINLTRKSSMEEKKKNQEKMASILLQKKQEADVRSRQEEEARKRLEQDQKAQEERRRAAEELERKKKQEEEETKRRAEEEAKRAEVKRKIAEMQQERLKQKQLSDKTSSSTSKSSATNAGRGFTLKLSTNPAHLFQYKALYSFTARNPDELSISIGDVVTVDESQDVEPDWLAGTKDGKAGWFPANYVEKLKNKAAPPSVKPPPQSAKPAAPKNPAVVTPVSTSALQSSEPSAFLSTAKSLAPPSTTASTSSIKPPAVGQRYRAIYPWIAKKENHLTFDKDDIIAVSEMQDMWWFGYCKSKSGWFPKSYVKELSSTTPVNIRPASPKNSPVLKRKAPAPPSGGSVKKNYVASYSFAGTESGDLSFNVGDVIVVTNMDGEWWTGSLNGKSGIFPANYVTLQKTAQATNVQKAAPVSSSSTTAPASTTTLSKPEVATVIAAYQATGSEQLTLQVGQVVSIRKKNDSGWWEGELQARGKKKQVGWFPANYVKLMTSGGVGGKATPSEMKKAKVPAAKPAPAVLKVMAMYDYAAQNSDELTFQRGAVIIVDDKSDSDWWKGTLEKGSASGLFPSNYVQNMPANHLEAPVTQFRVPSPKENEYQQRVMELINSEETYLKDLQLADEAFQQPLRKSKILTEQEVNSLFVNLNELIMTSAKLVKALRVRYKLCGDNDPTIMIGDILCEQIPHLHPYIRFCSCQLNASSLLQEKFDSNPEFKALVKKCESGDLWKGLPVSSYLVKPMQRITKYPLLIKKILDSTPEDHPDHRNLTSALEKAEEVCSQVNEGVRQKENSDRLEWLQSHVQLEGLNDKLVFNSKTNCLDQRKFLFCGTLYKHKSNKDLVGFLFNDFLLLTTPTKPLNTVVNDLIFSSKTNFQFRMYKQPIFLNEVLTRLPQDAAVEDPIFHLSHIDHVYTLRAENVNERTAWMNKIREAAELYIDTEKKRREKAYQARSQRSAGIGRLVVTIMEGCNLVKTSNGRHDPYCEVTMGEQSHTTKTVQDTLNPRWGSTMQFFVKDLSLDVLCISIFQRYMFSPDDFLGRTEVKLADINRDVKATKGPITKRLLLHEVDAGEVVVKLDLLLFENT